MPRFLYVSNFLIVSHFAKNWRRQGVIYCRRVRNEFSQIIPKDDYAIGVRIGQAFSSLCHTLTRKVAQGIQVQDIGKPEDEFLDAGGLQLG